MSELKVIYYSSNFNGKLFNKCHSTIRLRNDKKYILNEEYIETLKDVPFQIARIVLIYHFSLAKISEGMCLLDTGYTKEEHLKLMETMYKNHNFNIYEKEWSYLILQHVKTINNKISVPDK